MLKKNSESMLKSQHLLEQPSLSGTDSTQLYGNKCMPPRYSTYHYLLVSFTIAQDRIVNISSMQLSSSVNATMCWNSCLHSCDICLVRCNHELN